MPLVPVPPLPLPAAGGVVSTVSGTVGGIVGGVDPTLGGIVDQTVGTVLDTAGGVTGGLTGSLGGGGATTTPAAPGAPAAPTAAAGQLPADTIDALLRGAGAVAGDGSTVVVDTVAPTPRVRVLSRLTMIAHTSSLRLEISSDEAGVVAVGGALRPGYATRGHATGHSRQLVKWPSTVLGFRAPGKLQLTIKLSRAARINLARSRNARIGVATIAADARHNQRAGYVKLAIKR